MKKSKYILYMVLAAVLAMPTSCSNFMDVNVNPNSPSEVDQPNLLLPSAQVNLAYNANSTLAIMSSMISQQFSCPLPGFQTAYYESYLITSNDTDDPWQTIYALCLNNTANIEKNNQDKNTVYAGIAKIMKAYTFGLLVDSYGDIPYSEALNLSVTNPKYDKSKDIYDALFTLLDDGIAQINLKVGLAPSSDDFIYGGSTSKWIKLANTIKLRLALNYANVDNGQMLLSVISTGGPFMASTNDNFQLEFTTTVNRQAPYYGFLSNRTDYIVANDFMISLMNSKSDPRRSAYFTEYPFGTGQYTGNKSGDDNSSTNAFSRLHTYLRGSIQSVDSTAMVNDSTVADGFYSYGGDAYARMLTYAEYNFIMAEAVLRFGASGDAKSYYAKGIEASMSDAGVDETLIDAYITSDTVTAVTEKKILEEKYVANFGVPVQSWTDFRRTSTGGSNYSGLPALLPVSNATQPVVPRILLYPQSEFQVNPKNVPSDRPSSSIKSVFWDN